jgi:hypothetical protein
MSNIQNIFKNFEKRLMRDQLKKELCEEDWITLKYIRYYEDSCIIIPDLRELGLINYFKCFTINYYFFFFTIILFV